MQEADKGSIINDGSGGVDARIPDKVETAVWAPTDATPTDASRVTTALDLMEEDDAGTVGKADGGAKIETVTTPEGQADEFIKNVNALGESIDQQANHIADQAKKGSRAEGDALNHAKTKLNDLTSDLAGLSEQVGSLTVALVRAGAIEKLTTEVTPSFELLAALAQKIQEALTAVEKALAAIVEIKTPEQAGARLAEAAAYAENITEPNARAAFEALFDVVRYQNELLAKGRTGIPAAGTASTVAATPIPDDVDDPDYPHLSEERNVLKSTDSDKDKKKKKENRHKETVNVLWEESQPQDELRAELKGKRSIGNLLKRARIAYAEGGKLPFANKLRAQILFETQNTRGIQTNNEIQNERGEATVYVNKLLKENATTKGINFDAIIGKERKKLSVDELEQAAAFLKAAQEVADPEHLILKEYTAWQSATDNQEVYDALKQIFTASAVGSEDRKLVETYLRARLQALGKLFPSLSNLPERPKSAPAPTGVEPAVSSDKSDDEDDEDDSGAGTGTAPVTKINVKRDPTTTRPTAASKPGAEAGAAGGAGKAGANEVLTALDDLDFSEEI